MDGKWERHGEEKHVYENEWMNVDLVDVDLPDGTRIDYHYMRPRTPQSACVICYDPDKGVLMLWRHRFVNDMWGWEFPAGGIEPNEAPGKGAAREVLEETGWQPNSLTKLIEFQPMGGTVEAIGHTFFSEGATWVGPGRDMNEAADVAWVTLDQLRTFITNGEVTEGLSLVAALFALQFGPLKDR